MAMPRLFSFVSDRSELMSPTAFTLSSKSVKFTKEPIGVTSAILFESSQRVCRDVTAPRAVTSDSSFPLRTRICSAPSLERSGSAAIWLPGA
jgi:hypothetical protein